MRKPVQLVLCLSLVLMSLASCVRAGKAPDSAGSYRPVSSNGTFVADGTGTKNPFKGDSGSLSVRNSAGVPELKVEAFRK